MLQPTAESPKPSENDALRAARGWMSQVSSWQSEQVHRSCTRGTTRPKPSASVTP